MRILLLFSLSFSLLLISCEKFAEKPQKKCLIPYVDFVAQQVNTSTMEVSFTAITSANGTITAHKWDFGDGTYFDGETPPAHKYPALSSPNGSATYRIRYTVTNECGEAFWTKDITISGCLPEPKFSFTYLNDSTVQFTNETKGGSANAYLWNFGDGTTSTSTSTTITHVYRQTQAFAVVLKATNGCGENHFTKTVSVCKRPVPSQTINVSECGAVSINAAASKNGSTYQWDFGNGVTLPAAPSTSATINYTYPKSGSYTIKLMVFNGPDCDSASITNVVNINTGALGSNNNWSFTSDDLTFNFSRETVTNATSYKWNFGDGTTSSQQNPENKNYAAPGTYTVTLTALNNCGVSYEFSVPVNVPYYKALNNAPGTRFQQVLALSPAEIYFLGLNGKLYKADTAGNWSNPINLPSGLAFDNNTKLYRDRNNNLWIYGKKEVARFNPSNLTWTSSFSSTGFSNSVTISSMAVDKNGVLWTIGDGKVRKGSTSINSAVQFSSLAFAESSGRIWITSLTSTRLYYITMNSTQVNTVSTEGIVVGGDEIKVAPNNEIFFTTATGIIRVNSSGSLVSNYGIANTNGFISQRPSDFEFDSEGNIWVLSGAQLYKLPLANSSNTKNYSFNSDLRDISSISVLNFSVSNSDILLTKTSGDATIKIR